MKNTVMIKGNKYGIVLVLDKDLEFHQLLDQIGKKFKESSKFFDAKAQLAISFEGRVLTNEEISVILDTISKNSDLKIEYIIEQNGNVEQLFKEKIEKTKNESLKTAIEEKVSNESNNGLFYKGTLRSGQSIESESSIVIIGDVNLGAEVTAVGNIVVIGCLKGTAFAGCSGNKNAFVLALDMNPMQIRIGDAIARSSDSEISSKKAKATINTEAKIAFVEESNIYIEPISKDVLNDISI